MIATLRTIIEEDAVSAKVDAECEIYPRLEEAFDALKWWLAHRPDSGEPIDDRFWLYKQAGNKGRNIPALVALYWFDEYAVTLNAILVKLPEL